MQSFEKRPYDETTLESSSHSLERSNHQLSPSSPITKRLRRRISPTRLSAITKIQRQQQSAEKSKANQLHVVSANNLSGDSECLHSYNEISSGSLYSFHIILLVSNAI